MKIRLTESKFRYMLTEMMKEVLLEAKMSLDDIYNKYYSNIDKKVFLAAVKADPTTKYTDEGNIISIGDYTKWILNLVKRGVWKPGDSYETTKFLTTYHKLKNQLPQNQRDINNFKSVGELKQLLDQFTPKKTRSEIKQSAEKVYEDNQWIIIIPHTQEAAIHYGSGTKWCTAAKHGNNMFDTYNDEGFLYINIDSLNNRKYQFHFESNQFMDENDRPIDPSEIGLSQGAIDYYKSIGKAKYFLTFDDIKSYIQREDYSIFDNVEDFGDGLQLCCISELDRCYFIDTDNQIVGNTWFNEVGKKDKLIKVNKYNKSNYLIPDGKGGYKGLFGDMNNPNDWWFNDVKKKENCDWFKVEKYDDSNNYKCNYLRPVGKGGYKLVYGDMNNLNDWFDDIKKEDNCDWFWVEKNDRANYLRPDGKGGYNLLFGDINNTNDWFDSLSKNGNWFCVGRNQKFNYIDINGNELLDNWVPLSMIRGFIPDNYFKQKQKQQQNQALNEVINRLIKNYRQY